MGIPFDAGFECGVEWADSHPNWISVEDELPKINPNGGEWEFSDDVIVVLEDDIAVGRYERDNSTDEHYWVLYGVDKDLVVTHWMPLPQAPLVTDLNKKNLPPVSWQEGNILVKKGGGEQ